MRGSRLIEVAATAGLTVFISKCMHGLQACLFEYITVAAFRIYALLGEDAAKRGGWRQFIK